MVYSCPQGYVFGASCTLNCTHGYPLVGSDTITCERDDSTYPPTMSWDWEGPSAVKPECRGTSTLVAFNVQVYVQVQAYMNPHRLPYTGVRGISWFSMYRYTVTLIVFHAQVYMNSQGCMCRNFHGLLYTDTSTFVASVSTCVISYSLMCRYVNFHGLPTKKY